MIRFINFLHLFKVNLKRNFLKEIVLGLGVIFATMILITGIALGDGIEKLFKESMLNQFPVDEIKINGKVIGSGLGPNTLNLGPVTLSPHKVVYNIHQNVIDQIKEWPEVKGVQPISKAIFPVTLLLSMKLPVGNRRIVIEPPVIGIANSLAQDNLKKYHKLVSPSYETDFPEGFQQNNAVLPILIPSFTGKIIANFLRTNNLPVINIMDAQKLVEIKVIMDYSAYVPSNRQSNGRKPISFTGKIVGYIDTRHTSGIAIPQKDLEDVKHQVLPIEQAKGYESLIIQLKSPKLMKSFMAKLTPYTQKYKLAVEENSLFKRLSHFVEQGVQSYRSIVQDFTGIVLFINGIAIFYAFLYLFFRRESEMGLYRFFGATRLEVIMILVLESMVIGVLCAFIGYAISYLLLVYYIPGNLDQIIGQLLPKEYRDLLIHTDPGDIFKFQAMRNLAYASIGVLFCIAAAFIPALIGSLRPIQKIN